MSEALSTGGYSYNSDHRYTDCGTESDTIDDFSDYGERNLFKRENRCSLDSLLDHSTSVKLPVTIGMGGTCAINDHNTAKALKINETDKGLDEDLQNGMIEVVKRTTIKKIISRTTSVNGVQQEAETEEHLVEDSHNHEVIGDYNLHGASSHGRFIKVNDAILEEDDKEKHKNVTRKKEERRPSGGKISDEDKPKQNRSFKNEKVKRYENGGIEQSLKNDIKSKTNSEDKEKRKPYKNNKNNGYPGENMKETKMYNQGKPMSQEDKDDKLMDIFEEIFPRNQKDVNAYMSTRPDEDDEIKSQEVEEELIIPNKRKNEKSKIAEERPYRDEGTLFQRNKSMNGNMRPYHNEEVSLSEEDDEIRPEKRTNGNVFNNWQQNSSNDEEIKAHGDEKSNKRNSSNNEKLMPYFDKRFQTSGDEEINSRKIKEAHLNKTEMKPSFDQKRKEKLETDYYEKYNGPKNAYEHFDDEKYDRDDFKRSKKPVDDCSNKSGKGRKLQHDVKWTDPLVQQHLKYDPASGKKPNKIIFEMKPTYLKETEESEIPKRIPENEFQRNERKIHSPKKPYLSKSNPTKANIKNFIIRGQMKDKYSRTRHPSTDLLTSPSNNRTNAVNNKSVKSKFRGINSMLDKYGDENLLDLSDQLSGLLKQFDDIDADMKKSRSYYPVKCNFCHFYLCCCDPSRHSQYGGSLEGRPEGVKEEALFHPYTGANSLRCFSPCDNLSKSRIHEVLRDMERTRRNVLTTTNCRRNAFLVKRLFELESRLQILQRALNMCDKSDQRVEFFFRESIENHCSDIERQLSLLNTSLSAIQSTA